MKRTMSINETIAPKVYLNHKICVFGCGRVGKRLRDHLFPKLNIKVDYLCDNNSNLWNSSIDGIPCISPTELFRMKDCLCFILVGDRAEEEILKQFEENGFSNYITWSDISSDQMIQRIYFDIPDSGSIHREGDRKKESTEQYLKNKGIIEIDESAIVARNKSGKRTAIYTCVTNHYDSTDYSDMYFTADYDYYYVSDEEEECPKKFIWVDAGKIIPESIVNSVRRNRYAKIMGPTIFSEYEISVYIDGNIIIKKDIEPYVKGAMCKGMALHNHFKRKSIYAEAMRADAACVDDHNIIKKQIKKYFECGMPFDYGLFECNAIIRKNNDETVMKVMKDWWNEVNGNSFRDQLSFMYCLWKNGIKYEDLYCMGQNIRKSDSFLLVHNHR